MSQKWFVNKQFVWWNTWILFVEFLYMNGIVPEKGSISIVNIKWLFIGKLELYEKKYFDVVESEDILNCRIFM